MQTQQVAYDLVNLLVEFATGNLMAIMLGGFALAVIFRLSLFYTIRREQKFSKEFNKRVTMFITEMHGENENVSFYKVTKHLLLKTFYQLFELRVIMKRRRPDMVMTLTDRIFLVEQGCARLVNDTLEQILHLRFDKDHPKFLEISKSVFHKNGSFNKVYGIFSTTLVNDVLAILPGLFIVMGILGTFLGVMQALPELANMNLSDVAASQTIMDQFLTKISFSMSTSILGIVLSTLTTILNATLSAERAFVSAVENYENSLDLLWNHSTNNDKDVEDYPKADSEYDALAMDAVNRRINKQAAEEEDRAHLEEVSDEYEEYEEEYEDEDHKEAS